MGCRIWSVAHSSARPHVAASASDDGTVAVWGGEGFAHRSATLRPVGGWPVTCVDFCADDENALLAAGSDARAYVYDLRYWCIPRPLPSLCMQGYIILLKRSQQLID